jgi:hypothetical protein
LEIQHFYRWQVKRDLISIDAYIIFIELLQVYTRFKTVASVYATKFAWFNLINPSTLFVFVPITVLSMTVSVVASLETDWILLITNARLSFLHEGKVNAMSKTNIFKQIL